MKIIAQNKKALFIPHVSMGVPVKIFRQAGMNLL
jgi:hypothetical protein